MTIRPFITKIIFGLCIVGLVGFWIPVSGLHTIHAQTTETIDTNDVQTPASQDSANSNTAQGSAANQAQTTNQTQNSNNAASSKLTETPIDVPDTIEGAIYSMCVSVGGWLANLAGGLLDYAIRETILKMGHRLNNEGLGYAVDQLWIIVRDVFNILFIFGLIYIGFRTILSSEDSNTKKMLGGLIVAALLINFSLFITKAVVDFANLTSYQVYENMTKNMKPEISDDGSEYKSISGAFVNLMKATTYAQSAQIQNYTKSDTGWGLLATYGMAMLFVMLIAAFVFAAGAFLLIARFVGLIIFMILSPAMFLGYVFPLFRRYQDQWWENFLKYAFVAPAYLFMLYLSLYAVQNMGIPENSSFAEAFKAKSYLSGAFIVFLNFFIIAAFLIASLKVAEQMGAYGARGSMSMLNRTGNAFRQRAKGITLGTAGALTSLAGRNAVGRPSKWLLKSYDKFVAGTRGGKGFGVGINRTVRNTLEKGEEAKFGGKYSRKDDVAYEKETRNRSSRIRQKQNLEAALANGEMIDAVEALHDATNAQIVEIGKEEGGRGLLLKNAGLLSDSQLSAVKNSDDLPDSFKNELSAAHRNQVQANVITNLSGNTNNINVEIKDLNRAGKDQLQSIGFDRLNLPQNASRLTQDQMGYIDKLRDEGKITPEQATKIRDTRGAALEKIAKGEELEHSSLSVEDLLKLRPNQMANLPDKVVEALALRLPVSTLRAISDGSTQTTEVQRNIRKKITQYANNLPEDTPDEELDRIADVDAWLRNSPQAASFGV